MIMPRIGMVFVEISVQIFKSSMIGPVFSPAIEPVLVGARMGFANAAVELVVLPVIASMPVIVVVRECRHKGCGHQQQQYAACQNSLVHEFISFARLIVPARRTHLLPVCPPVPAVNLPAKKSAREADPNVAFIRGSGRCLAQTLVERVKRFGWQVSAIRRLTDMCGSWRPRGSSEGSLCSA